MKIKKVPGLCLMLIMLVPPAAAQDMDEAVLENDALVLTVKRTPKPHISRIVDKATEAVLVSSPNQYIMAAFQFEMPAGPSYIDTNDARTIGMEVHPMGRGGEIIISCSDFSVPGLSARLHGLVTDAEPMTVWTIEVHNGTGRRLKNVRFPFVQAVPAINGEGDDFIVLPAGPGVLVRRPREAWKDKYGDWLRFPGGMSSQFVSFQDRTAGLFLSSRDTEGHEKTVEIWKWGDAFNIAHDYYLPADAGIDWQGPYPVAIGITRGTWCDTADLYKEWATGQSWCARTLAERDDVPAWWREGPLVYSVEVRTYDGQGKQNGSYYPKLLDDLRYLKSKTDGRIVAMMAGWEKYRRWTAGDCFPAFDESNAKKVIAQMKGEGFFPFFYLSGLYYSFRNEGLNPSTVNVLQEYLPHFVRGVGDPIRPEEFVSDESYPGRPWTRRMYAFCVDSPAVKQFFRKMIDSSLELGVPVLQMDQTTGGAGFPCYSREHGHAMGPGLYQSRGLQALLRYMHDYGKGQNPDFVLTHEEPHEELIPYLDGFHMREYLEKEWHRDVAGAEGIPLFSYLYHEYVIGYGGDSIPLLPANDQSDLSIRSHGVNLAAGWTPGAAVWMSQNQLRQADPRALNMIKSHRRLLAAGGQKFLMGGRMLHPFEIAFPTLTYGFWRYRNMEKTWIKFTGPAVLTSSWEAPDGSVGHLFVNVSGKNQPLRASLDARNAAGFGVCDATVFRSTAGDRFKPLWKDAALPKAYDTVLAPDEVLFIELRAAARPSQV